MQRQIYVPPGGFVGAGSQTQAAQIALGGGSRNGGGGSRRRRRRSSSSSRRKRKSTRRVSSRRKRSGKLKFVKGSAAAKRHMARLRAMRKRK